VADSERSGVARRNAGSAKTIACCSCGLTPSTQRIPVSFAHDMIPCCDVPPLVAWPVALAGTTTSSCAADDGACCGSWKREDEARDHDHVWLWSSLLGRLFVYLCDRQSSTVPPS
jgi:hypothetical protein